MGTSKIKKETNSKGVHMNIEKYNERRHAKMAKFNKKGIFQLNLKGQKTEDRRQEEKNGGSMPLVDQ